MTGKPSSDYDLSEDDWDIIRFCVQETHERYLATLRYKPDFFIPVDKPRPSADYLAFIKRAGQLSLILNGEGWRIGVPEGGDDYQPDC